MTLFLLLIAGLATWRITVLVSRDAGPAHVFSRLRKLSPKWLGCPYCFSITAGAAVEAAFYYSGYRDKLVIVICIALALSAISIVLDRMFTADHKAD